MEELKKIQGCLLNFIDDEGDIEENFQNLQQLLDDQKIKENKKDFKLFIQLVTTIANNHHRTPTFFSKIEKILKLYENEIKKYFSNSDIYNLFSNKKLLLFLTEENIFKIDDTINTQFRNLNLPFKKQNFSSEESQKEFPEKLKIGENDDIICSFIRQDLIEEFITYVKRNDYSINSYVPSSPYETNPLLMNRTNLIEYAAFFGSSQIFKYLHLNGAKSDSLWMNITTLYFNSILY